MKPGVQTKTRRDADDSPLLAELRKAHADLLAAIAALDRLTHGPLPARERLVETRWKVSEASLSRRLLWGRIQMALSPRAGPHDRDELRRLQDIDIELLHASTEHVARWTAQSIMDDWSGYGRASRLMRTRMKAGIAAEQELLYPILRRLDPSAH